MAQPFRTLVALAALLAAPTLHAQSTADVTPVIHVDNPPTLLARQGKHYVVLVSLDGFRYDYAKKWGAPHLDAMARDGASTPGGMLPSYPSITFPNHYTLVTGLRPEHHGIVSMSFLDPDRGLAAYAYKDESALDAVWYYGTPLWVLAEQQGMRSACLFWPGSEAAIDGVRPSFYLHFDDKLDNVKRLDQVAQWLALPTAERPHLITLYYSDVDHAGHSYGPDAPETRDAVHRLDALVGQLRDRLRESGLPVDLIVTADHGMSAITTPHVVLDQFADLSKFKTSTDLGLYAPTEADAEAAYRQFRAHPDPRFTAYRRLDVPAGLHYNASPREGDPVIVPNGPYGIDIHPSTRKPLAGTHGFDPHQVPDMKAIFYAEGPDIKPGTRLASFDNVDVYPFIAHLLGLEAPPVDGTLEPLRGALK